MDFRTIKEEYNSIYTSKPQVLSEEVELIDEEAELDAIVDADIMEGVVLELIEEGYDGEELLEAYLQLVDERINLDEVDRSAAADRLARMKYSKGIQKAKERKEKVKGAIDRIKGAIKSAPEKAKRAVNKAKGAVAMGALKATGTKLKDKRGRDLSYSATHTQHKSVRDKAKEALKDRAKSAAKGAVRTARSTAKAAAVGATAAGIKAAKAAKEAPGRARDAAGKAKEDAKASIKDKYKKVKAGVKKLVGGAARSVSRGARNVARRMGEETSYDIVLEYLYVEGYADTLEEAEEIMVLLDREEIDTITECY